MLPSIRGRPRYTLRVREEADRIQVSVSDDGSGFDPAEEHEGHFGLVLMRERVEATGGSFDLRTKLGHGVVVSASIPTSI